MSYTQALSYHAKDQSAYNTNTSQVQTTQPLDNNVEKSDSSSHSEAQDQVYTSPQTSLYSTCYAEHIRLSLMEVAAQREKEWAALPMTFESIRLWNLFIQTLPLSYDRQRSLMKLVEALKATCEEHRILWSKRGEVQRKAQDCLKENLVNSAMKAPALRKRLREVHTICMILLLERVEIQTLSVKHDLLFLRTGVEELLFVLNSEVSKEALRRIRETPRYDGQVIENNLRAAKDILQQEKSKLPDSIQELMLSITNEQPETFEVVMHQLEQWGSILYEVYFQERYIECFNTSFLTEEEGILRAAWRK